MRKCSALVLLAAATLTATDPKPEAEAAYFRALAAYHFHRAELEGSLTVAQKQTVEAMKKSQAAAEALRSKLCAEGETLDESSEALRCVKAVAK